MPVCLFGCCCCAHEYSLVRSSYDTVEYNTTGIYLIVFFSSPHHYPPRVWLREEKVCTSVVREESEQTTPTYCTS